jgi:hypothetical protein
MARLIGVFFSIGLLLNANLARAADEPPAGTWKLSFAVPTQRGVVDLTFLIMFSEGDKGWVGDLLGMSIPLKKEPMIENLKIVDGNVKFTLNIEGEVLAFDGRAPKDGKKFRGTVDFAGRTFLVEIHPSKLKNLTDKFAMVRESLEQGDGSPDYFDAATEVLAQATAKKMKPEDVRALVDKALKSAESYGPRWERVFTSRVISVLSDQEAFVPVALELARQAERMLKPDDDATVQMQVLEALANALRKAKKLDELKPIESRLLKLEARDYAEYSKKYPPFKPDEFKGRKNKSDRAVLVELFTGAECPPCVAADLAFDALQSTYKPSEVVLLEYHMHVPGPDPLTNKDGLGRAEFYGDKIRGTPTIFFNGKKDEGGGGPLAAAKQKYASFREAIDEWLEKPAGAKLQLNATQKGSEIAIKASVNDLAAPGEKVMLRFALTEERVRYPGGNGLNYSHNVVRALPGGAKGVALTKKASEHTASVDLNKLREDLSKYLNEFAKEDEFPNPSRPLALKNLRVVAFVQNDETGEVLQAAQVEVEEKKGE